jgi:hypothetical protein
VPEGQELPAAGADESSSSPDSSQPNAASAPMTEQPIGPAGGISVRGARGFACRAALSDADSCPHANSFAYRNSNATGNTGANADSDRAISSTNGDAHADSLTDSNSITDAIADADCNTVADRNNIAARRNPVGGSADTLRRHFAQRIAFAQRDTEPEPIAIIEGRGGCGRDTLVALQDRPGRGPG